MWDSPLGGRVSKYNYTSICIFICICVGICILNDDQVYERMRRKDSTLGR